MQDQFIELVLADAYKSDRLNLFVAQTAIAQVSDRLGEESVCPVRRGSPAAGRERVIPLPRTLVVLKASRLQPELQLSYQPPRCTHEPIALASLDTITSIFQGLNQTAA
jgi:hypothetical protein